VFFVTAGAALTGSSTFLEANLDDLLAMIIVLV
jgi:hypothetical protein